MAATGPAPREGAAAHTTLGPRTRAALCSGREVVSAPPERGRQLPGGLGDDAAGAAGGRAAARAHTAFGESLNLDIRQRVAAAGRRVKALCQGEDGLRQARAVSQGSDNVCLPQARLRRPLWGPEPTNGAGSAKVGQPGTPARAAG